MTFIYIGLAPKAFTSLGDGFKNGHYIPEKHGTSINMSLPVRLYPRDGVGTRMDINMDFNVTIFNTFCDRNTDLVAVIPVYSATGNFKQRQAIRDTVGKNCVTFKCAVFFIVGVSNYKSVNDSLKKSSDSKLKHRTQN